MGPIIVFLKSDNMVPHVRSDHPTKYFGYWSKNSRVMDKSLIWPVFGVRQNHHPGLNASF